MTSICLCFTFSSLNYLFIRVNVFSWLIICLVAVLCPESHVLL